MSSLKLISLNIERSKHLDRVIPFLEREQPDVLCVQELMERDVSLLEKVLGTPCEFSPFTLHEAEGDAGIMGIGMFSRAKIRSQDVRYYVGNSDSVPVFDMTNTHTKHATENHSIIFCDIEIGENEYRIGTTHFTWTPDGSPDTYQRDDMKSLLSVLETNGEFVLTGDFNAPRLWNGKPGEIFGMLAAQYKDNIPSECTTTIDKNLHRAGDLQYVVDGLFSTPEYTVSDVRLVDGVSDHMAVVATVSKS